MSSGSSTSNPSPAAHFVTTHWSVVLSAQGSPSDNLEALESLCRTYWYPLYAYVRRLGHSPVDAEDLTQGFFARLVEKDFLKAAAQEKGRFRTFLLTALKGFLANEWDRQHAQKRGGFSIPVPIDQELAEARFALSSAQNQTPDVLFDRQWAVALLEQTIAKLQQEYAATGRATLFEHLRGCLCGEESAVPYAEIARELKLTEAAFKMAVYRVRIRYRALLREEIAQTVCSAQEVDEELRHLFAVF